MCLSQFLAREKRLFLGLSMSVPAGIAGLLASNLRHGGNKKIKSRELTEMTFLISRVLSWSIFFSKLFKVF